MERVLVELVEVLVHILIWQIAADEGAVDQTIRACNILQIPSSFALAQVAEQSCNSQLGSSDSIARLALQIET